MPITISVDLYRFFEQLINADQRRMQKIREVLELLITAEAAAMTLIDGAVRKRQKLKNSGFPEEVNQLLLNASRDQLEAVCVLTNQIFEHVTSRRVRRIGQDELHTFVNRRRFPRFRSFENIRMQLYDNSFVRGHFQDIGQGGARINSRNPLPKDLIFKLELPGRGDFPREMQVCKVCEQAAGSFRVEFQEQIAAERASSLYSPPVIR